MARPQPPSTTNSKQTQRGAALVLVLMVAAVFLILMGSLIDVLAMESQNASESADADAALTASYSGVDLLILSIEEFYQNSVQNGQLPQTADCAFSEPGGGTVETSCQAVLKQQWTGSGLNYYLIRSTGFAGPPANNQQVARTVDALVKEIPFGAYAMFTETDTSNTGGAVWYSSGQSYGGPVYSGGPMHIRYDKNISTPIFPDGFTTSSDANKAPQWFDVADNNWGPPQNQQESQSVFGTTGKPNFVSGGVSLPGFAQNLIVFSEAYYGDANHADPKYLPSGSPGVYVNAGSSCSGSICTGIFIQGDAQVTSTSVASSNGDLNSGSQTWDFKGGDGSNPIPHEVIVTVNFGPNPTTTVNDGGNVKSYTGEASGEPANGSQGNGALFVNGNLTINDGSTVHGQYTLAVPDPPQNDEKMTLTGSLTYSSDPLRGPSQDELALWADKIYLTSSNNNPVIDGMILTGYANECQARRCGGFFANSYCTASGCNGGGTGTLTLYGSLIENMRGKMGVVDSNGGPIGGYLRTDTYDPRLGGNPPPYSPTTNLYSIIALSDRGYLP